MGFTWDDFVDCFISGITYLPNTLLLVAIPLVLAFIFGAVIAVIRFYKVPVLSQICAVFVTIYQGVPVMVAVIVYDLIFLLVFDDVAEALGLSVRVADVNMIYLGFFVLTLMDMVYMSESLRGLLNSIDRSQFEAGYSVGLTKRQTLMRIVLPQVVPRAVPVIIGNACALVKASALVFTLGVLEVYNGSLLPCGTTFHYLEGYVAAAVIYWALTLALEGIGFLIERRGAAYRRSAA